MNISTAIVLIIIFVLCSLAFNYMIKNNSHCTGCAGCKNCKVCSKYFDRESSLRKV